MQFLNVLISRSIGGKPDIFRQSSSNPAYLLETFSTATLRSFVEPWYASLKDPGRVQGETLEYLMERYAETAYGKKFEAEGIHSISEFQSKFPISSFESLKPYFADIQRGMSGFESIFPEPITNWVMTRGTTGKSSKVIPTNQTHLTQILFGGARGIVNFALRKKPAILKRDVLNLNFPSSVYRLSIPGQIAETYGYSSGTYASSIHRSMPQTWSQSRKSLIHWAAGSEDQTGKEGLNWLLRKRARPTWVV